MTIILVDQDGVLADWAGQFIADLAAAAPEFTPDLTRWDFGLADA
jgi:hypothetical protein